MNNKLAVGTIICIGLLATILAHQAMCSDGPGIVRWHFWGPWTYGGVVPVKASSLPHFAVYPPVYYSHPIARPYGTSPFAHLPAVADAAYIGPGTVFVNPAGPKANPAAPPSSQPLVIVNPFAAKSP